MDWEEEMDQLNCEDSWQALKKLYNQAIDDHIYHWRKPRRDTNHHNAQRPRNQARRNAVCIKDTEKHRTTNTLGNIRGRITEQEKLLEKRKPIMRKKNLMKEFKVKPMAFYSFVSQNPKWKLVMHSWRKTPIIYLKQMRKQQKCWAVPTMEPDCEASLLDTVWFTLTPANRRHFFAGEGQGWPFLRFCNPYCVGLVWSWRSQICCIIKRAALQVLVTTFPFLVGLKPDPIRGIVARGVDNPVGALTCKRYTGKCRSDDLFFHGYRRSLAYQFSVKVPLKMVCIEGLSVQSFFSKKILSTNS